MAEWDEMRVRSGPDTSPKCAASGSPASGSENGPSSDASPLCRRPGPLQVAAVPPEKVQAPRVSRSGHAGSAPRPETLGARPSRVLRCAALRTLLPSSPGVPRNRGSAEGRDPGAHRK
ncbi:hypothetical protein NN561_020283 [Cricetulus griseus]